jgi:uncharacterized membrane protein YfcA
MVNSKCINRKVFKFNVMEQLTLTTPALLFSAVSLIILAYTNRFLAYASVVRSLHVTFKENRLRLTQAMQILGISSLLLCVICMFLIYVDYQILAKILFGIALVLLILSLAISIREIQISVKALDLHLDDME